MGSYGDLLRLPLIGEMPWPTIVAAQRICASSKYDNINNRRNISFDKTIQRSISSDETLVPMTSFYCLFYTRHF